MSIVNDQLMSLMIIVIHRSHLFYEIPVLLMLNTQHENNGWVVKFMSWWVRIRSDQIIKICTPMSHRILLSDQSAHELSGLFICWFYELNVLLVCRCWSVIDRSDQSSIEINPPTHTSHGSPWDGRIYESPDHHHHVHIHSFFIFVLVHSRFLSLSIVFDQYEIVDESVPVIVWSRNNESVWVCIVICTRLSVISSSSHGQWWASSMSQYESVVHHEWFVRSVWAGHPWCWWSELLWDQ